MIFYNFSGGMESAAMLYLERERIKQNGAQIIWANTGKQFPEMAASIAQIERILEQPITEVPRRISFDEFLFERGGMIRKGTIDCSKRMKRSNLKQYMQQFPKPWEINIGFNFDEDDRADDFTRLNEKSDVHWRYPLIEARINRLGTWGIVREAGFSILIEVYERMGRFDCFCCGNQTPKQARLVAKYYPELAEWWMAAEERKGHSFLSTPLKVLIQPRELPLFPEVKCACFGGADDFFGE